ncbi:sensor histidine kinase [Luteimonas huabeiensis]|uniref:sensor histidine kinase n=1 Tax=Luteimonas huabeiensis TaxID=1244513 RepID=UPI000465C8CB|nr:HAMP domain-containing sensor histidine kinase [Luteimonas huabeiensis]
MKRGRSIAWRIRFALTSLTSVALLLAGLLAFYTYHRMETAMVGDLVRGEAERLNARLADVGDRWEQPFEREYGPALFVWGESDRVRAPNMPAQLRELSLGMHAIERPGGDWHVLVSAARDGRTYVLYDTTLLDRQQWRFAIALAAIVAAFSLLALLVSGRVARWLVTPINAMTDRLARWAPGGGVDDIDDADEAARLLEVFNRVQDQVDSAIADQKEFSANLHHEIRTPLAIIRSDAEVMARHRAMTPEDAASRLRRIVAAVGEIGQSLESTYSLAHARADDVDPAQEETLSRPALLTVVRNVIRNAAMHAAPATLTVASIPGGLRFTDTGPGIAQAQLPHVFDRYFSGRRRDLPPEARDAGLHRPGLGLAIAKRVCAIQSWSLDVESPVAGGRGTRFVLRFRD